MKSTKYDRRKNGARRGKEQVEMLIRYYTQINKRQPVIIYNLKDAT